MVVVNKGNKLGAWTFLVGAVLALVFGLFGEITPTLAWVLVIIGLLVGILNIGDEETQPFLIAGAVLIIASAFGQQSVAIVPILSGILNAFLFIFVPATIIVSLKHVFTLARY